MSVTPRPISAWSICPPTIEKQQTIGFSEPPSPKLPWLMLTQLMGSPDKGRALFPLPLSNQNRLWREFSNYIRQAKAYWDGATGTAGSSAALLYYYTFLNLAKAELLTTRPTDIYGKKIYHGLSYSPTGAQSIPGDTLKVHAGAFSMLYEKRVGSPFSMDSMSVTRLLNSVIEVGLELEEVGLGHSQVAEIYHVVADDSAKAWTLIASMSPRFLNDPRHVTTKLVSKYFHKVEVASMPQFRDIFSLSRRLMSREFLILESKATFSRNSSGDAAPDSPAAQKHLRDVLSAYVEDPDAEPADAILVPSLLKSRTVPMPASLARYALMFYVSSLVRYKPSALDPSRQADAAWLLDSFTKEAPLWLLTSAYSGIINRPLRFDGTGFRL